MCAKAKPKCVQFIKEIEEYGTTLSNIKDKKDL